MTPPDDELTPEQAEAQKWFDEAHEEIMDELYPEDGKPSADKPTDGKPPFGGAFGDAFTEKPE